MPSLKYADLQLVHPQVISSTVLTDGQTRLWFRRLLQERVVLDRLKSVDPLSAGVVNRYRLLTIAGIFLLGLSAALALGAFDQWLIEPRWIFSVAFVVAVGGLVCLFRRRFAVAWLAARLVEADLPSLPLGVTLYQLGEIYGERYQVPSLVDVIWMWNQALRQGFVLIFFVLFGIYFVSFLWANILAVLCCWAVCLGVQGAVFFYAPRSDDQLKK